MRKKPLDWGVTSFCFMFTALVLALARPFFLMPDAPLSMCVSRWGLGLVSLQLPAVLRWLGSLDIFIGGGAAAVIGHVADQMCYRSDKAWRIWKEEVWPIVFFGLIGSAGLAGRKLICGHNELDWAWPACWILVMGCLSYTTALKLVREHPSITAPVVLSATMAVGLSFILHGGVIGFVYGAAIVAVPSLWAIVYYPISRDVRTFWAIVEEDEW